MPAPPNWAQRLREFVQKWRTTTDRAAQEEYLGDQPFHKFVVTERAGSWQECLDWQKELDGDWCFRGQRESSWLLHTSLDRAVKVEHAGISSSGYYHLDREVEQRELLLRFQQEADQHLVDHPSIDDISSWLAIMQHHGVPTRLLDWTESAYVALYFALAKESSDACAALWALDLQWLRKKGCELLESELYTSATGKFEGHFEQINGLLHHTEKPVIVQVKPLKTSERMVAQRGLLLCKLIHEATFSQILMAMMIHPDVPDRPVVRKLDIEKRVRMEFLQRLRDMDIHGASLFPGLDGIGKSLGLDLELKVKSARLVALQYDPATAATHNKGMEPTAQKARRGSCPARYADEADSSHEEDIAWPNVVIAELQSSLAENGKANSFFVMTNVRVPEFSSTFLNRFPTTLFSRKCGKYIRATVRGAAVDQSTSIPATKYGRRCC